MLNIYKLSFLNSTVRLLVVLHSINICTYNCENVETSVESIHNVLCDSVNCDVILLQEHWLYPDDLHFLSTVHADFNGFGVTPMSIDNKLLSGRPFIWWCWILVT